MGVLDKLVIAVVVGTGQGMLEVVKSKLLHEKEHEKEREQNKRNSKKLFARAYHLVQTDRSESNREGE